VHIVHVEQQDDVRKRVQHPNEVFNSILGNIGLALFNAQWLLSVPYPGGGVRVFKPPPPKFRRPSKKSCQTQPNRENC
jgi:hypothetical protein